MVTRYPHTALITYEIGGKLVNGEWVDGETKTARPAAGWPV